MDFEENVEPLEEEEEMVEAQQQAAADKTSQTTADSTPHPAANPTAAPEDRLKAFRKDFCGKSPISEADMMKNIQTGKDIASKLTGPGPLKKEEASAILQALNSSGITGNQAAVSLMWFLTAKTAEYNELYVSGSMRLAEGEKLRDFLKMCGQYSGNPAYGRISTHFKENLGRVGMLQGDKPQWGLDLRGMGLPAGKNTILFALQPDGSLYIKMEDSGCPPFWKSGFRTSANFSEWARHAADFVKSRVSSVGKHDILPTRKEHIPKNIKKAFETCMKNAGISDKKIINPGKKFGISKMAGTVGMMQWEDPDPARKELNDFLNQRFAEAEERGYEGGIKGEEVLIPSFRKIFSPQQKAA